MKRLAGGEGLAGVEGLAGCSSWDERCAAVACPAATAATVRAARCNARGALRWPVVSFCHDWSRPVGSLRR
jgi:hypothetical protein